MSVFQIKDSWTTQVASSSSDGRLEEFDQGSLAVGNVDNAQPPSDKVAVGSFTGNLFIYNPSKDGFRIEDLMIEEHLDFPILQLLIGQFITGTDHLGLAVLHPRQLVVYEVEAQGNRDGRINYYTLNKKYSHHLGLDGDHFTAYNMISGSFGGARGREMILVQSLDGKLQIFEQGAMAFTRQLIDCLIPGPLSYLPRIDAFVTATHSNNLECYKYQVLASCQSEIGTNESKSNRDTTGMFNLTAVRAAMEEWSVLLGDSCLQLASGSFSGVDNRGANEMLVLCDQSMFLIKDSGGVLQQRRLDFEPRCMCITRPPTGSAGNFLSSAVVAGSDGVVRVFNQFNLAWAAKLPSVPAAMATGNFAGLPPGMLVLLGDQGDLTIGCLGTRPPDPRGLGGLVKREVDYDKMDEEHRHLLQVIRESQNENKAEPKDKLILRTQVSKGLDMRGIHGLDLQEPPALPSNLAMIESSGSYNSQGGRYSSNGDDSANIVKMSIRVYLSYTGDSPLQDVNVTISAPAGLEVIPKNIVIPKVSGGQSTPVMVKFYLMSTTDAVPSKEALLVASYHSNSGSSSGEPRIVTMPIAVPLCLLCVPRAPEKGGTFKLTLDTTAGPLNLCDLFSDLMDGDNHNSSLGQAMGFQFFASDTFDVNRALQLERSGVKNAIHDAVNAQYEQLERESDTFTGLNKASASSNSRRYDANAMAQQFADVSLDSPSRGVSTMPSLGNGYVFGDTGANSVTVIVSKTSGRYRLLSHSLALLGVIANELEARLVARLGSPVVCNDALPLDELSVMIEAHWSLRKAIMRSSITLGALGQQGRLAQKRLLLRFKEKSPPPLAGLDVLLAENHNQVIRTADLMEQGQNRLMHVSNWLQTSIFSLVWQAGVRFSLTPAERKLLHQSFLPDLIGNSGQETNGWEETVDSSLTHLLKTCLAKNAKETAKSSNYNNELELPDTTDSLRKHMTMVFDRLSKGSRLINNNNNANNNASANSTTDNEQSKKK